MCEGFVLSNDAEPRGRRHSAIDRHARCRVLRAALADPAALPAIVDRSLASPELAETMQELHNETLLLRVEHGFLTFPGDRRADRRAGVADQRRRLPPAGGPSDAERALLAEWLACGVK